MNVHTHSRITLVFLVFALYYFALIINLYSIQIRNGSFFATLGQQQYNVTVTAAPLRAEIYDRNHEPLAINNESLSAFIIPQHLEQPENTKNFLKKYFPQAYTYLLENKYPHFLYIKRHLTPEQVTHITTAKLQDIKLLKEPSRFYPFTCLGPIVGLTDKDNQGILGIEYLYNKHLAGSPSTYILEKDARSGHFYFKRKTKIQGSQGAPIILTIDSTLQFLVHEQLKKTQQELQAQEVSAVIINPDTGDILTVATYPDFNPQYYTNHINQNTKNRPATDAYELGSVIKVFLALAAFEEELISPHDLINCENTKTITLDSITFSTWKAHGTLSFAEVIQFSNNIGVAKVAQKLGSKIYDHYTRLGFGKKLGIFPGESKGFINPPQQWSKASPISLSFGYEVSATLLQLAQAFSIITQDGLLVPLHIVKTDPIPISRQQRLYKPESTAAVKEILHKTVTHGTAKQAQISGYTVLGKTGTARLLTDGKYDPNRHIFTFMGLIEKNNYKRIIITCVKETKQKDMYASSTAVPLFEKIARHLLIHDRIL